MHSVSDDLWQLWEDNRTNTGHLAIRSCPRAIKATRWTCFSPAQILSPSPPSVSWIHSMSAFPWYLDQPQTSMESFIPPPEEEDDTIHEPSVILTPTGTRRPIAKLPVELVIRIMRSGLDRRSQISLSKVSTGFRDVSFLLPELWTDISPKFPLEKDQLEYWKWSITNSRAAPLDIKLNINVPNQGPLSEVYQSQGFPLLLPELVANAARWRTFKLATDLPAVMTLFLAGVKPVAVFSRLENLSLSCAGPTVTHSAAWFTDVGSGEPSQVIPTLQRLALSRVWTRHPRVALNSLVDLNIIGDMGGSLPSLEETTDMLKSSPNLEVLSLVSAPPPSYNLFPPPVTNGALHVILPRLRSLTFRGLSKFSGICILPLLHLPALEEFHLENYMAWYGRFLTTSGAPEDYSSLIQTITSLNMPWERPSDPFTAPPGPQWSQGKLKTLTLGCVTAEAMPLLDWLSFMRELVILRAQFSDVDLLRVLQDGNVCPRLQVLYVEGIMNPATRYELEQVTRARPNLRVRVEASLPGLGRLFRSGS